MTWEETILHFRSQPQNIQIVKDAYLEEDLQSNIERFRNSLEYKETRKKIEKFHKRGHILDIGAGNGISTIAFALDGYHVTALEPDNSNIVGAGAIKFLCKQYQLDNVSVVESFGEKMPFKDSSFDIVYGRQVMHHAYDLNSFVKECARVLKKDGIFMTVRDHVISNQDEKERFLVKHPLHKYYGGENAFKLDEYKMAILNSGLTIKEVLSPSESAINYSPWSKSRINEMISIKLGKLFSNKFIVNIFWELNKLRLMTLPGRLYSFIAIKS